MTRAHLIGELRKVPGPWVALRYGNLWSAEMTDEHGTRLHYMFDSKLEAALIAGALNLARKAET